LVEQFGDTKEIYEEPATAYVGDFLGVSNLMDASAHSVGNGGCRVRLGEF
jgi:spermidine/putrescine transport system ATP-binding protein